MNKKQKRMLILLVSLFIVLALISPFIGQINISLESFKMGYQGVLTGSFSETEIYLLLSLRLPRVIAAILTGSSLALAGLVMQACIQNPLADPFILGVSSGATAGATFAIVFLPVIGVSFVPIAVSMSAFLGGIVTTMLILKLAHLFQNQLTVLILIGVVINAICQSLTSLFIYQAPSSDHVKSATYWTMGSLVGIGGKELIILSLTLCLGFIYFFNRSYVLDLLLLGNEQADSLGIDSLVYQKRMMFVVAILTSVFVSQTGIIGFVGLIVPHLARRLVGNKHQLVIVVSMLLGSILLIVSDILARTLVKHGELPIGVVTSLIGAPLFFYIILDKYKMGVKAC